MKIFASNKLETLVNQLAHSFRKQKCRAEELFSRPDDLVIIQSRGMAKWINLQIAEKNQIATRIEYPFIRSFISSILVKCDYSPKEDLWDRESLSWRIFEQLPRLEDRYPILKDYVKDQQVRRHQLAEQLSSLFDEYMIYRHQWLSDWSQGKAHIWFNAEGEKKFLSPAHEDWQMDLWQELCKSEQNSFQVALQKFLQSDLVHKKDLELPKNISIFGITNMPPVFINFFEKLAEVYEVTLYHFSPCQEYWGDIASEKFSANPTKNNPSLGLPENLFPRSFEDEVPDLPHALLKSWGLLGRDFLNLLIENTSFDSQENYSEMKVDQSLQRIQNGILNLQNDFDFELELDKSITVNSCHNPRRELEVLHDFIIGSLKDDPHLRPHDIVVMAPNIQDYAPHIQNIFSHSKNNPIEFSIADQQVSARPLVTSFLQIFQLHKTRLSSNDILNIVENPDFLSAYKLQVDELSLIREWIEKSRIRWAKDAEQRASMGLPAFEENSWRFGFDRLMAGYAFDETLIYNDSLVCPIGSDGDTLGKFKNAVDSLFAIHQTISTEKKSLSSWCEYFIKVLESNFTNNADNQNEYQIICQSLQKTIDLSASINFSEKLEADVAIKTLRDSLQEQNSTHGFISRGITFCSLLPMRSIPVKVICMLGLNEGQFPRTNQRKAFDLMNENWKQGDRTMSLDDRYLFLESLLSARQKFYVSYKGKSERDNSDLPPSVILAEFIEYLKKIIPNFSIGQHALQPFSPLYFSADSNLSSFSSLHFQAASSLRKSLSNEDQSLEKNDFCPHELEIPEALFNHEGKIEIEIDELANFLKAPAKTFLKTQLGTSLWKEELSELLETEAFEQLNALEKYQVKEDFIDKMLSQPQDEMRDQLQAYTQADALLPYGKKGEACFDSLYAESAKLSEKILYAQNQNSEESVELHLEFELSEKVLLKGKVSRLFGQTYVPFHSGKNKTKHELSRIIKYLALLIKKADYHMHYCSLDTELKLAPSPKAQDLLGELIEIYLHNLRKPLAFFPVCYEAYLTSRLKGEEHEPACRAAESKWAYDQHTNAFAPGTDPINKLCFGKDHPDASSDNYQSIYELFDQLLRPETEEVSS